MENKGQRISICQCLESGVSQGSGHWPHSVFTVYKC